MDPNTVVLEISSDEESDWNDHDGKGIAGGGDDHNWLAELLDEVNKENFGEDDGGGDSDEVVVVNEFSPSEKPGKKPELKSCLVDLDVDCVILENDPDKPVEVRNDNPTTGDNDSDDLLVVSEKGQVACRDYPHPRHLCIKFPFSDTPNQSHCYQCYCYVCDSLAPCVYWGNGSLSTDHCRATDKDESWRLERKNAKNPKIAPTSRLPPTGIVRPAPPLVQPQNRGPMPDSTHARFTPPNFGAPNITNQTRSPVFASRNKFHPGLVSQLLLRTNGPRAQGHHNYNLATQHHRSIFKRPGSAGVSPTMNRYPYGSYRGNFGNPNYHLNVPQSQSHASSTVNPVLDQPLSFQPQFMNPNLGSQVNPNPYQENQIIYEPVHSQVVTCQTSHLVPCQPSYPVPSQTQVDSPLIPVSDYTQNYSHQVQSSTIDSSLKDYGSTWPPSNTNHQSATPMSDPSLAAVSGSLAADYQYDNWIFDDQPVESGWMDVSGAYYDSGFIDTGPIFDF